jgi:hypothetical protein
MGGFEHCDGGMPCMQRMDRIEEMRGLDDHQSTTLLLLSTRYSALPPVTNDAWAALRTTILEEALIVDSEVSSTRG